MKVSELIDILTTLHKPDDELVAQWWWRDDISAMMQDHEGNDPPEEAVDYVIRNLDKYCTLTGDMYYWVESAYEEWEAESEAIHQRD